MLFGPNLENITTPNYTLLIYNLLLILHSRSKCQMSVETK